MLTRFRSQAFKPNRVLVLSKTTRWESLASKREHGTDINNALRDKYEQQAKYVDEICAELK